MPAAAVEPLDAAAESLDAACRSLSPQADKAIGVASTSASQGSVSSPVAVGNATAGAISYTGVVSDNVNSYYSATVGSGLSYTVSISGMTVDVDLRVYSDAAFSTLLASSAFSGSPCSR